MAMGSALGVIALIVLVVIVGAAITGRVAEDISHPVEREVTKAATSIGFPLLALLIIVLICVAMLFCISSLQAFGGRD